MRGKFGCDEVKRDQFVDVIDKPIPSQRGAKTSGALTRVFYTRENERRSRALILVERHQ